MDPASLSQRQLCQWTGEMGYLLPTGRVATPTDLAAATSTPSRRRLCDIITRCFKDRRLNRRAKGSFENKNDSQCDNVEILRTKAAEVEHDIEQFQQKIIQRIKKIRSIEHAAKELQIKVLLFNKIKKRNISAVEELQRQRQQIQNLSSDTYIKLIDATKFLERNVNVKRKDWFDPVLLDEMMNILKSDNMVADGLWLAIINGTEQLEQDCHLQKAEAKEQLALLRSQIYYPINWINHVAKQRIHTISNDGIALLLRGVALRKISGQPYQEKLEQISNINILNSQKSNEVHTDHKLMADDTILTKSRINCDESQRAYDQTKNKSGTMLSKYLNGVENLHKSGCSLNKIVCDFNIKIECNAAEWRSLLQKCSISTKEHIDVIWHSPLSQIRIIQELKPGDLLRSDYLLENIKLTVEGGMNQVENMRHYVRELEMKGCLELNSEQWRKFIRSLEKTRDRACVLNDINQKINRTIQIYSDQPFANMIPNSFTVSNLTYKEWRLQFNLMCTPRRK